MDGPADAPITQYPSPCKTSNDCARLPTLATGRYSRAPAAALTAWPVRPTAWWRSTDHAVDTEGLGGPEEVAEVPGVLDLVQQQQEAGLSPPPGDVQQVLELRVRVGGHPGHDPLVMGGPCQGGQGLAGGRTAPDPGLTGQGDDVRPASPLTLDEHLVHPVAAAAEGLQDRVAPVEDQALPVFPRHRHVVPPGVSSTRHAQRRELGPERVRLAPRPAPAGVRPHPQQPVDLGPDLRRGPGRRAFQKRPSILPEPEQRPVRRPPPPPYPAPSSARFTSRERSKSMAERLRGIEVVVHRLVEQPFGLARGPPLASRRARSAPDGPGVLERRGSARRLIPASAKRSSLNSIGLR